MPFYRTYPSLVDYREQRQIGKRSCSISYILFVIVQRGIILSRKCWMEDVIKNESLSYFNHLCGESLVIDVFLLINESNAEHIVFSLVLAWTSCRTNSQFARELRRNGAHVMSFYCYEYNKVMYIWLIFWCGLPIRGLCWKVAKTW